MKDLNNVSVTGRLVEDSVEKTFNGVKNSRISFRIAIAGKARKVDGQWKDGDATFIPVVVWTSDPSRYLTNYKKGSLVMVQGSLAQTNWEKDGVRHSMIFIRANDSRVLQKPKASAPATDLEDDCPF